MIRQGFDFSDLIVFDLANNHQGSVEHALAIIGAIGRVTRRYGVRAGFKFQFRDLDSLIHPSHRVNSNNRHIPRFLGTRLDLSAFATLQQAVRSEGMIAMCTPFDEPSVDEVSRMQFDIIKIASASARDGPLLQRVAATGLPVIASTGGLTLDEIDNLVDFLDLRGCDFALMHCVSLYPTAADQCQLNQIDVLRARYSPRVIGWSTHEAPDDLDEVPIAVAKGARIFERHVGLPTPTVPLNAYSSTPDQIDAWLAALVRARAICGSAERTIVADERDSLRTLRRGVYVRTRLAEGEPVTREAVYFALPLQDDQLEAGQWQEGMVARASVAVDAPLRADAVSRPPEPESQILDRASRDVARLLAEARVAVNRDSRVHYSHHYGIHRFRETGAVIITCINREYCKKIVLLLPGQRHPPHHHRLKDETFQVLHGEMAITLDGETRLLAPGDTCLVRPGVRHSFSSTRGCVVEEISTADRENDTVYEDEAINAVASTHRKTFAENGRSPLRHSRFALRA